MQTRSLVVALALVAASFAGVACGGSHAESGANAKDPWSDFSGKYSTPGEAKADKSETAKADKADGKKAGEAKAKAEPKKEESTETDTAAAMPPPTKKGPSKGSIKGESVSAISVDTLTDVSKTTLKTKFVSNSVVTGAQYELVQVQLKGATVQITRPASTPQPTGPAVASPSTKKGEVSKNDASWYDEEADVLVVVQAGKKGAAQKALNSIVKH